MAEREKATQLDDDELDTAQGGGRVPAFSPEWTNPTPSDPGTGAGYIGETEKNLSTSRKMVSAKRRAFKAD
jgi:hypothetical protein